MRATGYGERLARSSDTRVTVVTSEAETVLTSVLWTGRLSGPECKCEFKRECGREAPMVLRGC